MSANDYTGEVVDVEVARYGLRTFRHVKKSQVNESPGDTYWTVVLNSFGNIELRATPHTPDDGAMVLASTYIGGSHWADGVCEATCQRTKNARDKFRERQIELAALLVGEEPAFDHPSPNENCGGGIYATHTLSHLRHQYRSEAENIVAVIAAEGQTIIGTKGFRTERARVVAYWCSDKVAATAASQFADAQRYSKIKPMLAEYGLEDGPSEMKRGAGGGSSVSWTFSPSGGVVTVPVLAGPTGPPPVVFRARKNPWINRMWVALIIEWIFTALLWPAMYTPVWPFMFGAWAGSTGVWGFFAYKSRRFWP